MGNKYELIKNAIELILQEEHIENLIVERCNGSRYRVYGIFYFESLGNKSISTSLDIDISSEWVKEGESVRDSIIRQITQHKEKIEDIYFSFYHKEEGQDKQHQNTDFTLKLKSSIMGKDGVPCLYNANQFPRASGTSGSLKILAQQFNVPVIYPNREQLKAMTKYTEVEAWTIHEEFIFQGHDYPFVLVDKVNMEDVEFLLSVGCKVYGIYQ